MIESYLHERQNLRWSIVVLDIRRDPSDDDLSLLEWLGHYRLPYLCILTKTDKLSNNQISSRRARIGKALPPNTEMILFSAITRKGKEDIWRFIGEHLKTLPKLQMTEACPQIPHDCLHTRVDMKRKPDFVYQTGIYVL